MSLIPERVWALLEEDEQARLRDFIQGKKMQSSRVECPTCGAVVSVEVSVGITARLDDARTPKVFRPMKQKASLPSQLQDLVTAAKLSGLFDQFAATLKAEKRDQMPTDVEAFFCRYWNDVQPLRLTSRPRDLLWSAYGQGAQVWGSQGVVTVVVGALIQAFIPQRLLRSTVGVDQFQIDGRPQFEEWVRGPFGYVPASAREFASALRQHSIGSFGRLVQ